MAKAKASQADSGSNTGGRPKGPWAGKAFRDALRVVVLLPNEETRKPKTKLDALALALVDEGKKGDVPALREIADRLDGKVPQALIGGGDDDPAIRTITEIRRTVVDPKGAP